MAYGRLFFTAYASSTYPIAPSDCFTSPATPSVPFPPNPAGQLTEVPFPTFCPQSLLPLVRYSLTMFVAPAPSDRWPTRIGALGRLQPALMSVIFTSFHD